VGQLAGRQAGDLLILCSDGLTTMIPDEDIARVVREAGGAVEKAAQALVASANAKGGEDNITVFVIRFDE
jgi:protein phosphatase